jgi:diguanylate cyclase (GGDEF)-like protein/PAS domain S-box-containing protein
LPNTTGEPLRFVDVATPVYEAGGEFKGVLVAHLSWAWAREVQTSLVDSIGGLSDVEMVIVSRDGIVLLQPDGTYGANPDGTYPSLDLASLRESTATRSVSRVETWPDGKAYLTGVARSTGYLSYPGLGWAVVERQPASAAFATARALQREIVLSGLGIALLFVAVGWMMAGRIARPLHALADATDRFRHGERGVLVEPSTGQDEVAALTGSLRDMMETVSEHEADLRRLNESLEQRVRERTRELRTLAHVARETDNGVIVSDAERKIVWVNGGFTRLTEYTLDEALGKHPTALLHGPETAPEAESMMHEKLTSGQPVATEIVNYTRSGQKFWVELEVRPIFDDDGVVANFVAIQRDVTARHEREARLRHDALHDPLTGLPNRALLSDRLNHVVRRAARERDGLFAVMFIDLNGFKEVNDQFGHAAGDQVLIAVTRRLNTIVRGGDTVARLGGDEFAIILEHVGSEREETMVAGRILSALQRPCQIDEHTAVVSASIGIALGGRTPVDGATLLDRADEAMYRAKQRGKACYEIAESDGDEAASPESTSGSDESRVTVGR